MNHKHYLPDGSLAAPILCHPERSLTKSVSNRQTQSKDLVFSEDASSDANFRVIVRFFGGEEGTGRSPVGTDDSSPPVPLAGMDGNVVRTCRRHD